MAIYSPLTKVVTGSQSFNATTSDIALGLCPSQDLLAQTAIAFVFPVGSGESTFGGIIFGKTTSASNNGGHRFSIGDNAGSPQLITGFNTTGTGGTPSKVSLANSVVYNKWNCVAATWDGAVNASGIVVYSGVNGAPLSDAGSSATLGGSGVGASSTGSILHIGNREATDRTFNGYIAYVARWSRVLYYSELIRVQQLGPLSIPQGLVLCWSNGKDYGPYGLYPTSTTAITAGTAPLYTRLGYRPARRYFFSAAAAQNATGQYFDKLLNLTAWF